MTCAADVNPVPVNVSVKAAPPAVADVWLRLVIAGGGAGLMVNETAFDTLLPGLTAVIVTVPGWAISVAGTLAVTCPLVTKVVVSAVVFHSMVVPVLNPLPFTVSENAAPPAVADAGDNDEIAGGALIVKVSAFETKGCPPGTWFDTVTLAVPAVVSKLAGTVAFN